MPEVGAGFGVKAEATVVRAGEAPAEKSTGPGPRMVLTGKVDCYDKDGNLKWSDTIEPQSVIVAPDGLRVAPAADNPSSEG